MNTYANIAVALNRKYVRYTYIMLTSLFQNNPDLRIRCFLLHSELNSEDIALFEDLAASFDNRIQSLSVDRKAFSHRLPTTTAWSMEAYYRLMLPDILPQDVDRLLYLDVDMIILNSLHDLYYSDFSGKLFVVCEDSSSDLPERQALFQEQFSQGYHYFNSGMMLWNITEIRKKYSFQYYMDLARTLDYQFTAPDQDLLNYAHWQEVRYADVSVYNHFARLADNHGMSPADVKKSVRILHYAGTKPWNADSFRYDLEQIWWEYARQTPFYNELCVEFLEKSLTDRTTSSYVEDLLAQIDSLKKELNESLSLNRKLLEMVGKL